MCPKLSAYNPLLMNQDFIKNRNRVVSLLDNIAKLLGTRKNADSDVIKQLFRIRQLANLLRDNAFCEDTIGLLYSHFPVLQDVLNILKNKGGFNAEKTTRFQDIIEKGLDKYKDENLRKTVSLNTSEFFDSEISRIEHEIFDSQLDLQKMIDDGKRDTADYNKLNNKIVVLKSNLTAMKDMARTKRETDDMTKALGNRMKPLSVDIENATKEITEERERLESIIKMYSHIIEVVIGAVLVWESILIWRIYPTLSYTSWINFIPFYLPIPLFAGLLWMSIYQVNRAQRQMMTLANKLHRMKYSDSLLKTSVSLYADIRKNEQHVAALIDNMIEQMKKPDNVEESKEQSETSIPIDKIVELIKAFSHK